MVEKVRCPWAQSDPLMAEYHDKEWGRIVRDPRELWETLMLEGFQAGLSWQIVLRKREGFRKAFHRFDPKKVAKMTELDVERLMQDPGIIRARAKINATIQGAKIFVEMEKSGEDFGKWIWSLHGKPVKNFGAVPAETEKSAEISKALKKRGFKFVGPTIVYAWMQAVGMVDDHSADCFRRKS
jgi:DNA-3-methyladenine glycosylase I